MVCRRAGEASSRALAHPARATPRQGPAGATPRRVPPDTHPTPPGVRGPPGASWRVFSRRPRRGGDLAATAGDLGAAGGPPWGDVAAAGLRRRLARDWATYLWEPDKERRR